ncbi:hypothetical protein BGW38_009842 [Lunasporangiospora selenospora]|uniref:Methionine synthase reductase n=1 Tax=Lunasporangiospora selenospora TaxID=979761 RepID=A0A9P6KHV1_9FUNG|nr:hypothetical protein BGW38_009842 [Lunasporangiospora selenospora]
MVPQDDGTPRADHLTVLFASQTGNAESISRSIHEQAQERGFKSSHYVLNDFAKVDWDKEECLVFVVSTTGDGDPPDNATKFWRHLRKLKGAGLPNAKYAILGLGDTNYDNFCQTAKKLDTRLQDLGASSFYARGLADDATGLEETVDPWIKNLWPVLAHQVISVPTIHDLPLPHLTPQETHIIKEKIYQKELQEERQQQQQVAGSSSSSVEKVDTDSIDSRLKALSVSDSTISTSTTPQPTNRVTPATGHAIDIDLSALDSHSSLTGLPRVPNANLTLTDAVSEASQTATNATKGGLPSFVQSPSKLFLAKINAVECLTPENALKRTLAVEFGFEDDVEYLPGDAFGIWAPNDESLVRGVLASLAIKDEDLIKPVKLEGKAVKKANLRLYADHAMDLAEKQKLMFLASKQGGEQFNAFRAWRPTFLDILTTFPSVKIPLARVIETLPPLQPRYYSITNSPLAKSGHRRWSCAFNTVEYEHPKGIQRRGVCTPWLDNLSGRLPYGKLVSNPAPGQLVPMFLKPNETKFNLPTDSLKPVIMIGPGTGVAPFMGFLEHRAEQRRIKKRMNNVGSGPRQDLDELFGEMVLFFGCRNRDLDWLFRRQMEEYEKDGVLAKLHMAVSREEDELIRGKYVQDVLRKESKKIWDLLSTKDASIYVCGDAGGMAKGVHDELINILVEHGGFEKMDAMMELNKWAQNKRYLRDLWA